MRKLHEEGTEALRVRIPKPYAEGLRKLAVGGKTVSSVVREALERYFGVECHAPVKDFEPFIKESGMMFPKAKWRRGK